MKFKKLAALFASFAVALTGKSQNTLDAAVALQPMGGAQPLVGTSSHGHTSPGATVPFGFVQLSPGTPMKGLGGCAGYYYSDSEILGFSHTHLSGTGIGDLDDALVLPLTGALEELDNYKPISAERFGSSFTHDNEISEPGYYRVQLDTYHVPAELPTMKLCAAAHLNCKWALSRKSWGMNVN